MKMVRVEQAKGRSGASPADDVVHQRVTELYDAEYPGMKRLAYTLISNDAEAEEVVQEAFVEVFRRYDELRRPGAYLRTAVVSRCRSTLRRRRLIGSVPLDPPSTLTGEPEHLWDLLQTLTEDQRIVVVLRYYGGYRSSEIADMIGMRAGTVRQLLRRGLAVLRTELQP